MHKAQCMINRQTQAALTPVGLEPSTLQSLRSFTSKHRPTLARYAIISLDLVADPTRCLNYVLFVELYPRPESRRSETAFYVIDASVIPLEEVGAQTEQMREQLLQANEDHKKQGLMGCCFVVLNATTPTCILKNVAPVGFARNALSGLRAGMQWRDDLKRMLNEGIVV